MPCGRFWVFWNRDSQLRSRLTSTIRSGPFRSFDLARHISLGVQNSLANLCRLITEPNWTRREALSGGSIEDRDESQDRCTARGWKSSTPLLSGIPPAPSHSSATIVARSSKALSPRPGPRNSGKPTGVSPGCCQLGWGQTWPSVADSTRKAETAKESTKWLPLAESARDNRTRLPMARPCSCSKRTTYKDSRADYAGFEGARDGGCPEGGGNSPEPV